MIEPLKILARFNIATDSVARAVQGVREVVQRDEHHLKNAVELIENLIGTPVKINDRLEALHVAQGLAERVIKHGAKFDPVEALKEAQEHATRLSKNPALAWLFNTQQPVQATPGPTKTVAGATVAVKANGKIKKGGKKELAEALFKQHVIGAGMDNTAFRKLLEKELDMAKEGATTYAYNARRAYEKETGSTVSIKKSKRGRKAKP